MARRNYVDILSINGADGKQYLRTAPWLSHIEEGECVMFQVKDHPYEIKGEVFDSATFTLDSEEYRLLKSFVSDVEMRVTKKIIVRDLDFSEYDKAEEEGELANG